MSKAYKPVNPKYLSTDGIVHNKVVLKDKIENIDTMLESHAKLLQVANYKFSSGSSTSYKGGSYIPFLNKVFDNTGGMFVPDGNGTITVNYTGYIRISCNLWIYSDNTSARPWLIIEHYPIGTTIAEAISSNTYNYQSLCVPDAVTYITSGSKIGIRVYANDTFRINAGTDRENASYVTLQIV